MEKNPQEIFDLALYAKRRARARKFGQNFLAERIIEDATERLLDANRQFARAVFIGDAAMVEKLIAGLPESKISDVAGRYDLLPGSEYDGNRLPGEENSVDLIVNLMNLHHVNDLPGLLAQHRRALRPDGLFIGAMFGGQTLAELRQAAYAAEEAVYGGISPRISPMADYQQLAGLMQRAGFALPVVDVDRVKVNYRKLTTLLTDIKYMGETSVMKDRSTRMPTRGFLNTLYGAYGAMFPDEGQGYPASFEIMWLTGWAPHESQQKPLRPGSAKMRLADALGATERKV